MKVKKEELSIKGYLIGTIRALCIICLGFVSYASKEAYLVLKDLNRNVIELNANLGNVNRVVEVNVNGIKDNNDLIHKLDKRITVLEVEYNKK